MDPDPAVFIIDLQDDNNIQIEKNIFRLLLFEGTFTLFVNDKSQKKSQNSRNQGFSYNFCLMIEGSGSIPLTNDSGSGSKWAKNMGIRNTGFGAIDLWSRNDKINNGNFFRSVQIENMKTDRSIIYITTHPTELS